MSRLILLILLLTGVCCRVKAQQYSYNYLDSLSYNYYLTGQWEELLRIETKAKASNISFPLLYMRLGYAAYILGNYSLSMKYYFKSLEFDSYNQDALYFSALNNTLLGRTDHAVFISKKLEPYQLKLLKINQKKAFELLDFETSIKSTNTNLRKTGQYYRLGITNRINYRWKLQHNIASYRQQMLAVDSVQTAQRRRSNNNQVVFRNFLASDVQYYLKSVLQLNSRFELINAFHYTHTNFDNSSLNTAIFNCGLRLYGPFADLKLELNMGSMFGSKASQLALSSTYFPSGNLHVYGTTRVSIQNSAEVSQTNYTQSIGFKVKKKLWIEVHGTFGEIYNLIDNDALYIYDALDPGVFRLGTSFIVPIHEKLNIMGNYYYEQKKLYLQNSNYNLHSFTTSISWKL